MVPPAGLEPALIRLEGGCLSPVWRQGRYPINYCVKMAPLEGLEPPLNGFEDRSLSPVWRQGQLPGIQAKMAFLEGFEPPTFAFVGHCSIH